MWNAPVQTQTSTRFRRRISLIQPDLEGLHPREFRCEPDIRHGDQHHVDGEPWKEETGETDKPFEDFREIQRIIEQGFKINRATRPPFAATVPFLTVFVDRGASLFGHFPSSLPPPRTARPPADSACVNCSSAFADCLLGSRPGVNSVGICGLCAAALFRRRARFGLTSGRPPRGNTGSFSTESRQLHRQSPTKPSISGRLTAAAGLPFMLRHPVVGSALVPGFQDTAACSHRAGDLTSERVISGTAAPHSISPALSPSSSFACCRRGGRRMCRIHAVATFCTHPEPAQYHAPAQT